MLGWHFIREDRTLGYGDDRLVRVGETLTVDCQPGLCEAGLHASPTVFDALQYAPGPVLCRVELGGVIVRGDDKSAATKRTVLKMADVSAVLHEFACRCAEDALALVTNPDPHSLAAIETKRRWLKGQASDSELAAAWAAARAVARVVGRDAAWDAAWVAAGAVARAAARAVARAAARAAARVAARVAAWDAARVVQRKRLASMLHGVEWESE